MGKNRERSPELPSQTTSRAAFARRYAQRTGDLPMLVGLPETDERGHLCAQGDRVCSNRGKHPISKLVPLYHTMATQRCRHH